MVRWWRYFLRSWWFWGALGITVGMVGFFAVVGDPPWGIIASFFPIFVLVSVGEFARLPGFRRRPRVARVEKSQRPGGMPSYDEWDPSRPLIGEFVDPDLGRSFVSVARDSQFRARLVHALVASAEPPHEILNVIPRKPYETLRTELNQRGVKFLAQNRESYLVWERIFVEPNN